MGKRIQPNNFPHQSRERQKITKMTRRIVDAAETATDAI
jgi:hypothetical protein